MGGLYVLPPTPYDSQGNLCETTYRENLEALLEFDIDGIVSPGSNGEWWTLPDAQRRRQMEILHEACHGKVVTATCCSSTDTADSIEKTRWAQEIGIDAAMNVPPFYFPLTRDELRRYYHDVAEACPEIGLIIYNFPIVAQRLSEDLMKQLADELPTLCGSKESHLDYSVWLRLHRNSGLVVMSAVERIWFTSCMKQGAKGMFSVLSASVPGLIRSLYAACREQDWETADDLEKHVWQLAELVENRDYLEPYNRIAVNKALVDACGWLRGGHCRAPLISVPDELVRRLREDLEPVAGTWLAPARQMAT